jgi:hypothetical protein
MNSKDGAKSAFSTKYIGRHNIHTVKLCIVMIQVLLINKIPDVKAACMTCPDNSRTLGTIDDFLCPYYTYPQFVFSYCVCKLGYGYYIQANDVQCISCYPGKYRDNEADYYCSECATGTHSDAGATSCTAVAPRVLNLTDVYSTGIDVDANVSRSIESLDIDKYLASKAPGLFACAVIGLVGAVLNSVAILVLFLWVKNLKSEAVKTDAGAV